jgi:hypothetical protein
MRNNLTGILVSLALGVSAFAQDAASPQSNAATPQTQPNSVSTPAPTGGAVRIAPGSVIPVQLTKSVDAKKAKPGDAVEARVTQDLKATNGEVMAPKDTKVVGRVTSAQPRSNEQKESQIGIAFDHMQVKNGDDAPIPMSIQAVIAQSALSANNTAAAESADPSPVGGMPGNGGPVGMGSPRPQPTPGGSTSSGGWPSGGQSSAATHPPITGNTEGVVGISNLKLSAPADAAQGSLLSSDKGNVKLESGTVLLLRVNQ